MVELEKKKDNKR